MEKIKIGVVGAYRGNSMINACKVLETAEVVAICDKNRFVIEMQQKNAEKEGLSITFYEDYDEFLTHDMDAVVLANFATEHAPFAVKAMKAGKHVYSEVLPVQTMKEAVELVECVEETGKIYAYGENYCFMPVPYEIRKLYREGKLGEFEYGEGEYVHNCESIWPHITYGDPDHWRNNMYANYYCTHSIGPIIHITGLRPVSVVGFESTMNERSLRCGKKSGQFGIEMITMENGGIIKSLHGDLYKRSSWFCVYGSKGRAEAGRQDTGKDARKNIYVNCDEFSGEYPEKDRVEAYFPARKDDEIANRFGHGNSDYYIVQNFIEKLRGNPDADIIDVYEALDMFLPGMFAYRSVLAGNVPMEIPNLRDKAVRDQYRSDVACTDPKVAGEQLLPVFSKGTPDIPDEVYDLMKEKWEYAQTHDDAYLKKKSVSVLTDKKQ